MERPAGSATLTLGEKAPYFSLPATDGKIYSLSDFLGCQALVVVFTCNHCPVAQAYENRICALVDEYSTKGVSFIAICANDSNSYPEDSFDKMKEKSRQLGSKFPYLYDESQAVAQAYDAACTPEAFLFDKDFRLQYHGWIDDNHLNNPDISTKQDLKNAIHEVLSGAKPTQQLTPVIGCSLKWKPDRW